MSNLVFDESSSNREASHGYAWWFSGDYFREGHGGRPQATQARPHAPTRQPSSRLTIFYFLTLAALSTTLLMTPIATPERRNHYVHHRVLHRSIRHFHMRNLHRQLHHALDHLRPRRAHLRRADGWPWRHDVRSLIALAVNHHLKATQRMLTANELGTTKLGEIKGVLTVVITTAFVIEGITFVALFPGLYKVNHGNVRHTLWESLFFAVMAYNNAGFTPRRAPVCMSTTGRSACRS